MAFSGLIERALAARPDGLLLLTGAVDAAQLIQQLPVNGLGRARCDAKEIDVRHGLEYWCIGNVLQLGAALQVGWVAGSPPPGLIGAVLWPHTALAFVWNCAAAAAR